MRTMPVRALTAAIVALGLTGGVAVATRASAASATTLSPTTTRLVATNPVASYGQAGKFVATVRSVAPRQPIPTGSVDFYFDGAYLWTYPLDATGKAIMPLADFYPSVLPGTYQITAVYSGDATYDTSTSAAVAQTIVGRSAPALTTITSNLNGLPVFSPRSFTLSSLDPYGCNVTIKNSTPNAVALVYGTPGNWKRLPFGVIAAGGVGGVGVGLAGYTGYFSTLANTRSYIAIHCT